MFAGDPGGEEPSRGTTLRHQLAVHVPLETEHACMAVETVVGA